MHKYVGVSKLQFKLELSWRLDIAFSMLYTVIRVVFALVVWTAVFQGQTQIAGFTLPTMLSFYVVTSFIASFDTSEGIAWEVSDRIKHGTFTKFLVIPADTQAYFQFQSFGASLLHMLFDLGITAIAVILFRIPLTLTNDPVLIASAIAMVLLGMVAMNQINFLIGLLAFRFIDIGMFLMIKNNLFAFLTGTMVPLALLPVWMQGIMRLFPFYYVSNLPAMLMIGRQQSDIPFGFTILLLWIAVLTLINTKGFARMRKRYDGVGV